MTPISNGLMALVVWFGSTRIRPGAKDSKGISLLGGGRTAEGEGRSDMGEICQFRKVVTNWLAANEFFRKCWQQRRLQRSKLPRTIMKGLRIQL